MSITSVQQYKESLIGTVVSVATPMGEVVGRCLDIDGDYIGLERPRVFVNQGQQSGFANKATPLGIADPQFQAFSMASSFAVSPVNLEVEQGWMQATSGIVLAGANSLQK